MKRYLAFISYRHRDPDQQVSTALLKGLEAYHLPKDSGLPAKRRVFRDADELPTGTDLGANIEGALDDSGWLIALCSKEYLASQWCLLEVERFVKMGRKDRILPVLLSGTPETSVPEEVRDLPLAADLRGEDLSYDRKKLAGAVPALLSRMSAGSEAAGEAGDSPLQPEDFAAAERRFRWKAASAAAACILAGILGFAAYALHTAGLIAEGNKKIAEATDQTEKARAAAEERRKGAQRKNAQYAAEQSMMEYRAGNEKEAIALALSVLPEDPGSGEEVSPEALGALRMAMSIPHLNYRKKSSAETETAITGYSYLDAQTLLLEGEEYTETGTFLSYDTGELQTVESTERPKAFSEGFSRVFVLRNVSKYFQRIDHIYCGAEKQARILYPDGTSRDLTLSGGPFFADRIVYKPGYENYLAWLEEPAEGQEGRMAFFFRDREEAVAEIPMDGAPLSAEFLTGSEIMLLDHEGVIHIFNSENGVWARDFPGRWTCAHFLEGYRAAAADADGSGWSLLDTVTGKVLKKVETPSPVRGISWCSSRSAVLACCEDGVRLYNLNTGNLIWSLIPAEAPRFALWARHDPGRSFQDFIDGNAMVLLFEQRAEVWTLDTEAEDESAVTIPLYQEGFSNRSERVFFSKDGEKVFVQMRDGTLEAFDARDGSFLWGREGSWMTNATHSTGGISTDGRTIWMCGEGDTERIDAETGRSVYSFEKSGGRVPAVCPEQGLGVIMDGKTKKGFDLETGEVLWEAEPDLVPWTNENGGTLIYSKDGKKLFFIRLGYAAEDHTQELYYAVIDSRTGKKLDEKVLTQVPDFGQSYLNDQVHLSVRGKERLGVLAVYPGKAPAGLPIFIIDLEKGEVTAEVKTPGPNTQVIFSASGGIALRWMEEEAGMDGMLDYLNGYEDSYVYCCSLQADGTMGPAIPLNSEEGRRLTAWESQLIRFGGEEAVLNMVQSEKPNQIRRLSDNALLLDVGENIIAAPVSGGNICVYSDNITTAVTPFLLTDIDAGTLIREAAKRLEELP